MINLNLEFGDRNYKSPHRHNTLKTEINIKNNILK